MGERSITEWMLDLVSAIGLLIAFFAYLEFRTSGPFPYAPYNWLALAVTFLGVVLLVGGVIGSRKFRRKRLAKLYGVTESEVRDAN